MTSQNEKTAKPRKDYEVYRLPVPTAGGFMARHLTVLLAAFLLIFTFSSEALLTPASAAGEQRVYGWLVRHGDTLTLQSDDGDYVVTGKDLSRLEGKMVEAIGTVTETNQGATIKVQRAREVQE